MNYLEKELEDLIQTESEVLRFLQDRALDGWWYWDMENMEEKWMSERFWKTLGYSPAEMPHKSSIWKKVVNRDDLKVALKKFEDHCNNPGYPFDEVLRYKHNDGHTVWMRCRGLVIRDENNRPFRMLGAQTDVTKQKKSELELKERLDRYNQIIDGAALGTWEWDLITGELYLNEYWYQLIGVESILKKLTF